MSHQINNPETSEPPEGKKPWPAAVFIAFLIVVFSSFMPWGTINENYTWQFMNYMSHPGLCNTVYSQYAISGTGQENLKQGAKVHYTASAWKSGFNILGFFYPHWLLTVAALLLFGLAAGEFFGDVAVRPSIYLFVSFYGILHVGESALGFFSQGIIGPGLLLTGLGYVIFLVVFLRRS